MLPSWVESVAGLIGQLRAVPIRASKRAVTTAAYLGVSFAAVSASLVKLGIAKPLSELADSKFQKIKSIDIADAAKAHNKALSIKLDSAAKADLLHSKADVNRAKARAIDKAVEGKLELVILKEKKLIEQDRAHHAKIRLLVVTTKLRLDNGDLYLDTPGEPDNQPN